MLTLGFSHFRGVRQLLLILGVLLFFKAQAVFSDTSPYQFWLKTLEPNQCALNPAQQKMAIQKRLQSAYPRKLDLQGYPVHKVKKREMLAQKIATRGLELTVFCHCQYEKLKKIGEAFKEKTNQINTISLWAEVIEVCVEKN